MATFNQCQFIGRLGKDPDLQVTSEGKPYTRFSLAVDQGKDETMWLNITCWDKLAEVVEKYARKGMLVFLQGKLKIRKYTDKTKGEQLSVEVIASVVQLLERKPKEEGDIPDDVLPA